MIVLKRKSVLIVETSGGRNIDRKQHTSCHIMTTYWYDCTHHGFFCTHVKLYCFRRVTDTLGLYCAIYRRVRDPACDTAECSIHHVCIVQPTWQRREKNKKRARHHWRFTLQTVFKNNSFDIWFFNFLTRKGDYVQIRTVIFLDNYLSTERH